MLEQQQQLFSHEPISCFTRRRLLTAEACVCSSPNEAASRGAHNTNPESAETASASVSARSPAAASVETREWLECTASGALLVAHQHDPRAFFDANGSQANAATPPPFSALSGTRLQRLLAGELPDADTLFDSYRQVTRAAAATTPTGTFRPVANSAHVTTIYQYLTTLFIN